MQYAIFDYSDNPVQYNANGDRYEKMLSYEYRTLHDAIDALLLYAHNSDDFHDFYDDDIKQTTRIVYRRDHVTVVFTGDGTGRDAIFFVKPVDE